MKRTPEQKRIERTYTRAMNVRDSTSGCLTDAIEGRYSAAYRRAYRTDNADRFEIETRWYLAEIRAAHMFKLIREFVLNETSQTSYAELKGSQSMDIPCEFLALCEFAEEMGVKLP
jgi:hypothetical protein